MTGMRGRAGWLSGAGFVVALLGARAAVAQVTQTDAIKTPLPQPVGSAELNIVNDSWAWNANTMVNRDPLGVNLNPTVKYGDFYAPPAYPQFVTGDAINLSGLFKWRKETIDPKLDAKTGPGYFSAKCGFSAELLLVGGNCQPKFGWYNVLDPASKTPPAAIEIYPLIGLPQDVLQCVQYDGKTPKADGFCPLAWDNRDPYDLSILRWTRKTFSSGDLSSGSPIPGRQRRLCRDGRSAKVPADQVLDVRAQPAQRERRALGDEPDLSIDDRPERHVHRLRRLADVGRGLEKERRRTSTSAGADGDFNDYVVYVSRASCPGEVDTACASKICPKGETCELGVCKDPCADVVCAGDELCVKGACLSSSSGAGGSGNGSAGASAAHSGGSSSTGAAGAGVADAGEESSEPTASAGATGDDDGSSPEPGTDAGAAPAMAS